MRAHENQAYEAERRTPLPLLTVNATAEYLAISREQVYRLVRLGQLKPLRVGTRLRFRREDLDAYTER